jgi:hypothetical protein
MSAEAGGNLLDRAIHLLLVSDVGGKALNLGGDRGGGRRQIAIDDGDLLDHLFFKQRVDDPESESARSSSHDCVFH